MSPTICRYKDRCPNFTNAILFYAILVIGIFGGCTEPPAHENDVISFGDAHWLSRSATPESPPVPPGNNYFDKSYGPNSAIYVDQQGHLHLQVTKKNELWHSAEIRSVSPLVPGTYSFRISLPNQPPIDPNIAVAFFLYADDEHEVDIEISEFLSRFNCELTNCASCEETCTDCNIQFVLQPYCEIGNWLRFQMPGTLRNDIYRIETDSIGATILTAWQSGSSSPYYSATFQLPQLAANSPPYRLHLSIWLQDIGGVATPNAPSSQRSQKVVIEALDLPDRFKSEGGVVKHQ